jgi:hypothetical protein
MACGRETDNFVDGLCPDCLKAYRGPAQATEPILTPLVQETAQDRGEPSPVPYSIFINSPAVMTEETGIERLSLSLSVRDLSSCNVRGLVPDEAFPFIDMAKNAFRRGYYRFELIVGDLSIRIYKHPNNP